MDCDPACQKKIINFLLVALLAEELASESKDSGVTAAALKLGKASRLFNSIAELAKVYEFLVPTGRFVFEGCAEATALLGWIAKARGHLDDSKSPTTDDMVARMHEWIVDLHAATLHIVSGTSE